MADQLERHGLAVRRLPVAAKDSKIPGALDLYHLDEIVRSGQLLFQSCANNEMGLVHPISDIADIVHAHGALLHVDCAQAVGTCSFDVAAMGAVWPVSQHTSVMVKKVLVALFGVNNEL